MGARSRLVLSARSTPMAVIMDPNLTSLVPPLAFAELTPIGGRIGPEPEDFRVDEVPLYPASGEGAHLYVQIEKRLWTTAKLVKALSEVSGVRDRDIGYAGLKDRYAVTTQWFSFPDVSIEAAKAWVLPEGVRALSFTRHNNKLRTGHLAGNRFRIRLVGVEHDEPSVVDALVAAIRQRGLPNYYGRQRFGKQRDSLQQAFDWIKGKARIRDRFLLKLLPSVIQAEHFNRYLQARAALGLDKVLPGEVVRLNGSSKVFLVEDAAAEQPRLTARDIHLTGPLCGPKMKAAEGPALALEQETLATLGLSAEEMAKLGDHAPGTRRDLVLLVESLRYVISAPKEVLLDFALPAGAYATQVIAEFTRGLEEPGAEADPAEQGAPEQGAPA
jgi:tRNA pseudouridine13 synthase